MQAARASDKVAYQSQSLPVVDIRRTYHMRARACMWREACSVVGSRQGSSGEKVGTGNKAFVGDENFPLLAIWCAMSGADALAMVLTS